MHSGVPHVQNAVSVTCRKAVGKGLNKDFENTLEEETQIFLGDGFTTDRHTTPALLRVGVVSGENREWSKTGAEGSHCCVLARLLSLDHYINSDR